MAYLVCIAAVSFAAVAVESYIVMVPKQTQNGIETYEDMTPMVLGGDNYQAELQTREGISAGLCPKDQKWVGKMCRPIKDFSYDDSEYTDTEYNSQAEDTVLLQTREGIVAGKCPENLIKFNRLCLPKEFVTYDDSDYKDPVL